MDSSELDKMKSSCKVQHNYFKMNSSIIILLHITNSNVASEFDCLSTS